MHGYLQQSAVFIFFTVLLLNIVNIPNSQGFKCFECVETDDATRDLRDKNSCVNVIPSGRTTNCLTQSSAPYCLKIDGVRDGQHVGVRVCASDDWRYLLKSTDRCEHATELNRRRGGGGSKIKIDHGMICICDSDYCNTGSNLNLNLYITFAVMALVIMLS